MTAGNNSVHAGGLAYWLKNFSQWDGWILVLGGGIVLAGWCLGNEPLERVFPGFAAMNPVTAVGFIAAGVSLLCFWQMGNTLSPVTAGGRALAGLLVVLGALKICGYEFGWRLPFDQALFHNQIRHGAGIPNQIAPNTAFNFLIGGFALWLLNSPRRGFSRWAESMSLTLLFVSLVSLVGYIYGASYLYSFVFRMPMALNTAIFFCLLAFGTLLAQTDAGVVAVFTSRSAGGILARRLLPFAFGVPFGLGALATLGERLKAYPGELGVSIIVVGSFAVFSALIWWNALTLNRADEKRRYAEVQLQRAHDELEARVAERTASLRQANEQLLRSQRMESLGALAGGIAHDLNNALAPVIMGAALLKQDTSPERREMLLETILASANRGTEMVRQLLSFARGTQNRNGPVHMDSLLKEMARILRHTFPKSIAIDCSVNGKACAVRGDVTELHQVLLNLCINARDAMPRGGRLTLAVESIELTRENIPSDAKAASGSYVMLTIADTGTGIPPEVLPRIFEPFFTTKAADKGTGLGLSTVDNIVRHHNGFIRIRTEMGKGTGFRIYLPALPAAAADEAQAPKPVIPAGHGEMIMIMDDEQAVRELAKTTLENYGYRVVTAANGLLGITCFEEFKNDIRVVVSDRDMPLIDGVAAVQAIQRSKPGVRIIIASGGKYDSEVLRKIDATQVIRLTKPYTVEQLLAAVAEGVGRGK